MLLTQSSKILFEPISPTEARFLYSSDRNETGILYRITGVLFVHGWTIDSAEARTEENGSVDDVFSISKVDNTPMDLAVLEKIERDVDSLMRGEIHMSEYMISYPDRIHSLGISLKRGHKTKLTVETTPDQASASIFLQTWDRPGILFVISQMMYLMDYDIVRFEASTEAGIARDRFQVRKCSGGDIRESDRRQVFNVLQSNL